MVTFCSVSNRFLFPCLNLFIFVFALNSIAASDPDVYSVCSNPGPVATNSVYQANINTTLAYLASNSSSTSRFYNTTVGFGDDKVYGLYFCLGDSSDSVCQRCVSPATIAMTTRCLGQKVAELWYSDKCMVRYSNKPFLETMKETPMMAMWNSTQNSPKIQDVTRNTTGFNQVLDDTLEAAAAAADKATVGKRTATKEGHIASNLTTIYTLVECSLDITVSACKSCLQATIGNVTKLCNVKAGCSLISLDCNLRYDTSPFYGNTIVFSSSPTVYSPSPIYRGRRRRYRKTTRGVVIGVVVAVVVVVIILGLLQFLWKRKTEQPRNDEEQTQNNNADESQKGESTLLPKS